MAKILIADDEEGVQELVRRSLESQGHEVLVAGTGPDTLAKLKKFDVDLLILDVMLPGMDGYTLQLEIAQDEKTRKVPVVVLTAVHPSRSLFSKFTQVKKFIPKPFDPMELQKIVAEIIATSAT